MSHNLKMSFYEELEDIRRRVAEASEKAREGRALGFGFGEREDIQMIRLLKEIQLLLESVL